MTIKGFFPALHEKGLDPRRFFNSYLQTYVERDLRAMVQVRDLSSFQKFLVLVAGRIGQLSHLASLSNDVGVSPTTVKIWLSVLKASYILFQLPPWFENVGKRLVKSSKLYFVDTGARLLPSGARNGGSRSKGTPSGDASMKTWSWERS